MNKVFSILIFGLLLLNTSCGGDDTNYTPTASDDPINPLVQLNLPNTPLNYANQSVPNYITKDNTSNNVITDNGATLGRVLFYDKNLSVNNTIACASCHKQSNAFSDTDIASIGVNGSTGRHSMRLINARFSNEPNFFWDERATSLEDQATQPIKDLTEMGWSGSNGNPSIQDLLVKMEQIIYYNTLFQNAFGSSDITEERIQNALAQFIRSIQSFDSKFDVGLAGTNGMLAPPFSNFTQVENQGKQLFLQMPQFEVAPQGQQPSGNRIAGGVGCITCHQAPEFDISVNGGHNGVVGVIGSATMMDFTNTRAPSLRDVFDRNGDLNTALMHDGSLASFDAVLTHYNDITFNPQAMPGFDPRLNGTNGGPGGNQGPGQKLQLTQDERDALTAFIKTLSGNAVYTDERWSDPF